jgi:transitional endoplasmic reticulum ATPase
VPTTYAPRAVYFENSGRGSRVAAIHRTIVLPFQRPDLYETYGRRVGGGILLYGPPGVG